MNGFLYGVALQWKLDIRSKSLLVTCYIVPLIFFLLMGGIFTSVMPEMRSTLIHKRKPHRNQGITMFRPPLFYIFPFENN